MIYRWENKDHIWISSNDSVKFFAEARYKFSRITLLYQDGNYMAIEANNTELKLDFRNNNGNSLRKFLRDGLEMTVFDNAFFRCLPEPVRRNLSFSLSDYLKLIDIQVVN